MIRGTVMPLNLNETNDIKFPTPNYLTLTNWKMGVITLIDKSRIPKNALEKADNIFLYEDGQPGPRPGVNWFGTAPGSVLAPTSPSPSPSASLSPSASSSPSSSSSLSLSPSASISPSGSRSPSASPSISPSSSQSPSASQSLSPSSSMSPSASRSPSGSRSPSASSSPSLSPSTSISPSASKSPSSSISASVSPSNSNSPSPSLGNWPAIDGFDYFDDAGAIHIVAAAGGAIYRSLDNAQTWTACVGASYIAGTEINMNQNGGFLYITDGIDTMFYYDGSTTLQTFTVLATPAAATAAKTGLGGGTGITYYYKVSAVNTVGFSVASTKVSIGVDRTRDAFDTSANYVTLTMPGAGYQGSQTRFDIYISTDDLTYNYLDSITAPTLVYIDNGTSVVNPAILAPTGNTTQGPLVAELTNVGSRQYGVRDTDNPYRIWFSSGTPGFTAAFSSAYDGGYINWQTGGKYRPTKVEDYRDGKGTPLATVWCKSADGLGCVIQISLDTLTIGSISVTVPSAYKLPGSRGTSAPKSVVNVLNDYFFYNSQAFYNLGSRAQFLNLLSTDEASANIRPSVRQITTAAEDGVVATYYYARIYFSVPLGATENNTTIVYDTERKAWLPSAFTIGFSRFLNYVDTNSVPHLLCLKPGDPIISEINDNIQGDYGEAFTTDLLTGLYQTSPKDRYEFQYTEEMEFEYSNPQDTITTELLGTERQKGFVSIKTAPITVEAEVTNAGWDTFGWDTTNWDDTSMVPITFSESSLKRYTPVQQEINNVQWHITTNTLNAKYVLRSLQTWGSDTQAGHPPQWRVKAI